jgi:segregation and condensation protein B
MELKFILEAILFSAQKPLSIKELREVFANAVNHAEGDEVVRGLKKVKELEVRTALEELAKEHEDAKRSYRLACVSDAWQFVSEPEYAPWLKALVGHRVRPPRLSPPGIETLTIIAYRQPITRAEIEQIRGVNVDGVMQTLLERGLVEQMGRAEVVGRPMTYGTTALFLEYFGLRSLEDLPAGDELRKIVVQKPEALMTTDPGLATAPPDQLALEGQAETPAPSSETKAEEPAPEPQAEESAPVAAEAQPVAEEAAPEPPKPKGKSKKQK